MKALNPSTGNLEEVYVKAIDGMPVGTEVDFDGQVNDIPTGWEQVSEVLWTNSAPSSNFNAQTIQLDLTNYDKIEIIYRYNKENLNTYKKVEGQIGYLSTMEWLGGATILSRNFTVNTTGVVFSSGYSGSSISEQSLIPYQIIGYK